MKRLISLTMSVTKCYLKIVVIMSKNATRILFEVLKAVVYALSGYFGMNAVM